MKVLSCFSGRPWWLLTLALILPMWCIAGCSVRVGGSKSVDRTLADLRDQNAMLRLQLRESQGKLAEVTSAPAMPVSEFSASELALATPRVIAIEFASSSGIDLRNPQSPVLIADVVPRDGLGRFMQVVGRLTVEATLTSSDGTTTERLVTLEPVALRDAYRSGVLGTRYVIERHLTVAELADVTSLRLQATLLEPSGQHFVAEREMLIGKP